MSTIQCLLTHKASIIVRWLTRDTAVLFCPKCSAIR